MHLRISNESNSENSSDELMRDVQTVAELLLEPLITTLLVMDRDILSTITVNYLQIRYTKSVALNIIEIFQYFLAKGIIIIF